MNENNQKLDVLRVYIEVEDFITCIDCGSWSRECMVLVLNGVWYAGLCARCVWKYFNPETDARADSLKKLRSKFMDILLTQGTEGARIHSSIPPAKRGVEIISAIEQIYHHFHAKKCPKCSKVWQYVEVGETESSFIYPKEPAFHSEEQECPYCAGKPVTTDRR